MKLKFFIYFLPTLRVHVDSYCAKKGSQIFYRGFQKSAVEYFTSVDLIKFEQQHEILGRKTDLIFIRKLAELPYEQELIAKLADNKELRKYWMAKKPLLRKLKQDLISIWNSKEMLLLNQIKSLFPFKNLPKHINIFLAVLPKNFIGPSGQTLLCGKDEGRISLAIGSETNSVKIFDTLMHEILHVCNDFNNYYVQRKLMEFNIKEKDANMLAEKIFLSLAPTGVFSKIFLNSTTNVIPQFSSKQQKLIYAWLECEISVDNLLKKLAESVVFKSYIAAGNPA